MGLNGYLVLLLGFQIVGLLKRGGGGGGEEDGLLMHAPISIVFSLFFLSLSFFPFFFYVTPFLVFITFFPWVLLPWVPLFWMPPPHPPSPPLFSSMATTPLYNGLISWNFSLLPLGLYQLFLVCCRHPFRTARQPIGCSATTTIG